MTLIPHVHHANMLEILPRAKVDFFDSVVTDPPYHLTSVVKRFGPGNAAPAQYGTDGAYSRASRGFMGKQWDGGDIAFRPETWAAVLRVMKPGAHLLAFSGTRTYHRMVCAIEDAGFEIRDQIGWLYGTGFPKSHNQHGEWEGWGTALKPAWEPICLARRPLADSNTVAENLREHRCGAINISESRVGNTGATRKGVVEKDSKTVSAYGNGLNGGVVEKLDLGRWPANVIHDGSEEVKAEFAKYGESKSFDNPRNNADYKSVAKGAETAHTTYGHSDSGTASRFFYCAKASAADRAGSKHPTVKPLSLMRHLVKMITPPNGRVLDPFAGSGTTLQAAYECGFHASGIEMEAASYADIMTRIAMMKRNTK